MERILFIDGNNIAHKNYHTEKKNSGSDDTTAIDFSISKTLLEFYHLYKKVEPHITILAFDSGVTWREKFTESSESITHKVYKANRKEKKTQKELAAKRYLNKKIDEMVTLLQHTKLYILQEPLIEADDFAGAICDMYSDEANAEVVLVSSDKDYLQLLKYDNVKIINPLKAGKPRTLEEWNNDANLLMFEKCIRGDTKDNVRSSYPRIRKTNLIEAYYDDLKRSNVLNHKFTETIFCDKEKAYVEKEFVVGDIFTENEMLLCLDKQPKHIKKRIKRAIIKEMGQEKTLDFLKFLRFAGKNELGNISSRATEMSAFLKNTPP